MATVNVVCKSCGSESVYKHGKAPSGEQRYRCKDCHQCFQMSYLYKAHEQGVPEQIVAMAMNGAGIRDTARVLGISPTTVMTHLKNSTRSK